MKLKIIDTASYQGSPSMANEDLIVTAEDLCLVLDGATGLGEQRIASHASDAVWFVEAFSSFLLEQWQRKHDFAQAVGVAIDACIDENAKRTNRATRPDYEWPSAGMVAIVIEDGAVRVFRLGDCTAYYKEGVVSSRLFDRSPLEMLDARSINALAAEVRSGKDFLTARERILPMLKDHRSKMNKPGGYGALSLTRECLRYMEENPITCVRDGTFLLVTDGFSAVEQYKGYSAGEIIDSCESLGLNGVIKEIRDIENSDLELKTHPRLKPHDDATAALIHIGEIVE